MRPALTTDDTIVAVASATGPGIRGVVRLSGPQAMEICGRLFGWPANWAEGKRRAMVEARVPVTRVRVSAESAQTLPGQLLVWPDQRSFAGQPSAEWHGVAPPPLLERVVERFVDAGARLARPGEFTLRAFLAGRLDLSQAEAVLGLIHAADDRQFETGLRQLAGGLAHPLAQLREDLLGLLADLEAGLDFVEEDIEFISESRLRRELSRGREQLVRLLEQMERRSDRGDLPRVVLAGAPNAGKSSLFNALVAAEAAIVSPEAGTTRDWVERHVDWGGRQLVLVDTAGLEARSVEGSGSPGSMAQQQVDQCLADASLVVACIDRSAGEAGSNWQLPPAPADRMLIVATKADLPQRADFPEKCPEVSSRTGQGIDDLRQLIVEIVRSLDETGLDVMPATVLRSASCLRLATRSLEAAIAGTGQLGEELIAAEIRSALAALGEITGAVCTDDLLDRIFSRFCIGK